MDFLSLEREALALPAEERAQLARDLLASLETLSDHEIDALWRKEASARAVQLETGEAIGVAADDVFREAEVLFR
jgi:putative addiction module component (TIGR02574 family)